MPPNEIVLRPFHKRFTISRYEPAQVHDCSIFHSFVYAKSFLASLHFSTSCPKDVRIIIHVSLMHHSTPLNERRRFAIRFGIRQKNSFQ